MQSFQVAVATLRALSKAWQVLLPLKSVLLVALPLAS
jgi:hypothetical protein